MINKNILNRISELEKIYPIANFNIEDYKKDFINILEQELGHTLTINLPDTKYYDKDTLERDVLSLIPIEDLRVLAYTDIVKEKE